MDASREDELSAVDKHARYYNSKKNDPEFRAKNAARSREYRKRKKEASEFTKERRSMKQERAKRPRHGIETEDPDIPVSSHAAYHNPHPEPLKPYAQPQSYNDLYHIRCFLVMWKDDWGPVACWPFVIENLYKEALAQDAVDEWEEDLKDKIRKGHIALDELKSLFMDLTKDAWMVRDLWCQAFDLVSEIHEGVACVRAQLKLYSDRKVPRGD